MLILLVFAFVAGIVTILSPCILPILPIILSSAVGGKGRPIGVTVGFVLSFTFFTLLLTSIVRLIGIPAESLRVLSIAIILLFGISLLIPQFQLWLEKLFAKVSSKAPQPKQKKGFIGGLLIGFSLGLLWTPCVGPILASVISLALTGQVTSQAFLITIAYSLGTAIPMFLIMIGGNRLTTKLPHDKLINIQKLFGVLMILTALMIAFNLDRQFQSYVLDKFPQYGANLTKIEDNQLVNQALKKDMNKKDKSLSVKTTNMLKSDLPKLGQAPEIIAGGEWFNTDPLSIKNLRGKVVLVDFWTYTCINCQRTLPYLKSWWDKYGDQGLVIIGVHSPEFEFEKVAKNVQQAIQDFGLNYPIVQDNDFATWRAYENSYWPAKYLIDKDGELRYFHFGEGEYVQTEENIQQLLRETGKSINKKTTSEKPQSYANTPETYLGYERIDRFVSLENIQEDKLTKYTAPKNLSTNQIAYEGKWKITSEYAQPQKGAKLILRFDAKEVFLVMRPKTGEQNGRLKVTVDQGIENTGKDIKEGIVTVTKDDLYKIVKLSDQGVHALTLDFLDSNLELYAFTFG